MLFQHSSWVATVAGEEEEDIRGENFLVLEIQNSPEGHLEGNAVGEIAVDGAVEPGQTAVVVAVVVVAEATENFHRFQARNWNACGLLPSARSVVDEFLPRVGRLCCFAASHSLSNSFSNNSFK